MHNPYRHVVNSERVFVLDTEGYIEVLDTTYVWSNPQLYTWVNSSIDGDVMLHFFEFTG